MIEQQSQAEAALEAEKQRQQDAEHKPTGVARGREMFTNLRPKANQ